MTTFVDTHGHAAVPTVAIVDGFRLGAWVSRCRSAYRGGALAADHVAMLESLPGWEWDASHRQGGRREAEFARGVATLRRYVEVTGSSDVPFNTVFEDFNLGVWARSVRQRRRHGRLGADRITAIESVAPGWLWERCHRRGFPPLRFRDAAQLAANYVNAVGVCDPQPGQRHRGFPVGRWLLERRIDYSQGQLTAEQIDLLERTIPGWEWHV